MEKKLDGNYKKMLRAILNNSWRQQPSKQQLYHHLPPLTKTIKIRRTWHAGHCWRSRDELIRDVLLWTSSHGRATAVRPAQTYIQQFCVNKRCSPGDVPEAMEVREGLRERVRDIRDDGVTWWWWWWKLKLIKNKSWNLKFLLEMWMNITESFMVLIAYLFSLGKTNFLSYFLNYNAWRISLRRFVFFLSISFTFWGVFYQETFILDCA